MNVGNKPFSRIPIPIEEIAEFYRIDEDTIPKDRPYIWYMFVTSLDGIGSFLDFTYPVGSIGLSGPGIALSHMRGKWEEAVGSAADYRLLNYGWATADAVVGASGIIHAEPELIWAATDEDLKEFRRESGRDSIPLQVIITGKGFESEQLKYPIFNPKGFTTIIATSRAGYNKMELEAQKLTSAYSPMDTSVFEIFGEERVDLNELVRRLRSKYSVKLLDLQGGPDIANQFYWARLADEYRGSISPVFVGSLNEEGKQRPNSLKGKGFGPLNAPTGPVMGRRWYQDHTFLRTGVNYHH